VTQGIYGADVQQLRDLAASFERAAGELQAARQTVGRGVETQFWLGPVALRFKATWREAHSVRTARAASAIEAAARGLRTNADEQERASAGDRGSPATGSNASSSSSGGIKGKPRSGAEGRARDLLDLCERSYDDPGGKMLAGWQEANLKELGLSPSLFDDPKSGFQARLFKDANGNYVLAFRGSNSDADWVQNLGHNAWTFDGEQQGQAMTLAHRVKLAVAAADPDARLEFTGHSLGGGLASLAAISTGDHATTFNAAGVTNTSIRRAEALRDGRQDTLADVGAVFGDLWAGTAGAALGNQHDGRYDNLVTAYRTWDDPVTLAQERTFASDAVGRQVTLIQPHAIGPDAHGIPALRDALGPE
jgi:hypothetical protein